MRVFACFLLIASLAADGAALPHSHAGSGIHEPAGHDSRPHVHLWGHAHEHDGHHHAHHHASHAGHRHAAASEQHDGDALVATWHARPAGNHDDDVLYLNASATLGLPADSHALIAAPIGLVVALADLIAEPNATSPVWAPPRYGAQVPIFLASTRLVI